MQLLQKELLHAGNLSPHVVSKNTLINTIPINAGLQKPPLQLNPINHTAVPKPMMPNKSPLSSLNFAEKANRPTLDPINLNTGKKMGRGISSTSRSGFTSHDPAAE